MSVKINKCVIELPPTVIFESWHEVHSCIINYFSAGLFRYWHSVLRYDGFARWVQALRCNFHVFDLTQILNGLQHQVVQTEKSWTSLLNSGHVQILILIGVRFFRIDYP